MDDLVACYGWSYNYGWPAGTPTEISDPAGDCHDPNGKQTCDVVLEATPTAAVDTGFEWALECSCSAEELDRTGDCCNLGLVYTNDLLATVEADCPGLVDSLVDDSLCAHAEAIEDDCSAGDPVAAAPGTDLLLDVDGNSSFITVTSPVDSETVALLGGGSASSNPDGFLTAITWAAPGTLGSTYFNDWMFWFESPVPINLSGGTFVVPASSAPFFYGSGMEGGVPTEIQVAMSQDAAGSVNMVQRTWDLDFTESNLGWTVTIHLEGTFVQI